MRAGGRRMDVQGDGPILSARRKAPRVSPEAQHQLVEPVPHRLECGFYHLADNVVSNGETKEATSPGRTAIQTFLEF